MLLFDQVAPDTPHQLGLLSGTKSESTRSLLTAMDTFLTDVSTGKREVYGEKLHCRPCGDFVCGATVTCPICQQSFCWEHKEEVVQSCCGGVPRPSSRSSSSSSSSCSSSSSSSSSSLSFVFNSRYGVSNDPVWQRELVLDLPGRPNAHSMDGEEAQINAILSSVCLPMYSQLGTRHLKYCASSSATQQTLDVGPCFLTLKKRLKKREAAIAREKKKKKKEKRLEKEKKEGKKTK